MTENRSFFPPHHIPAGGGNFPAVQGMKKKKTVHNPPGGEIVEQSKTVVIDSVTYEVSRVFAGKRSSKDLLKYQLLAAAASLTKPVKSEYNNASRLVCEKEVT